MQLILHSTIAFVAIVSICFGAPFKSADKCGYGACNVGQPDKLNVHIVPHTHDDVGWLKTVDQYFYGARNDIQHAAVQYILDSVIPALIENPDRRFIYVEMAFFWRWWLQQSEDMKNTVKQLVNSGHLEFISGGWCMNDEGVTHYSSIIDQHSLGAEFLRDEFGECGRPKLGWQIDPFGHSREVASLFAQMGFDGLFFGRVDFQDYAIRNMTKTMEMIWKGSANLGEQSWLFTGILPRVYTAPASFCFDYRCRDEPIKDDPRLHDYDVDQRVQAFIDAAHIQARSFTTNHIMMTMGSDFHYENANEWFKNLEKLIKHVNAKQANGSDVNLLYSTPTCYLYALNNANQTWTTKTDDFFPISYSMHGLWNGYFTSRPALKRYERHSNNILQVTKQLNAFSNITLRQAFFPLNEAMGVAQHHDAVSGTEKQHVADDYALRLSDGIDSAIYVINQAYKKLLPKENRSPVVPNQFLCQLSNISECLPIEGQDIFTLTIWNPTIQPVQHIVHVPVTKYYTIRSPTERKRDYRPSWNYTVYESVSGNYYPIPSRVWIKDNQRQMTILTDRSEGGSSMHDGSVELMIHRRTLYDDSQGVGEPMNETAYGKGLVICGKHFLIIEPPENSALYHRRTAQQLYMSPISTYALPTVSYTDYSNNFRQTWSALTEEMPYNVHLLTLDQLTVKVFLIRIEHYFELHEDDTFSKPVQVDLQFFFDSLGKIMDLTELTLSANLPLNDMNRLIWRTANDESSYSKPTHSNASLTNTIVTLNPMQIKTFQVTLE
ncbi:unnamed protein product [Rotaria magnacalcarata]|uniref:alpha-mannosidase n=1 Tax=Rotaria magnacalcarata TaxID=392030 RepID=A0A8S2LUE1_9BILA|nr:unnamed protein product [Rotaria magnacalcarata]CAF3921453.1 unnamed protein product [Rotaria magnacalcarata]